VPQRCRRLSLAVLRGSRPRLIGGSRERIAA
jgi:hypothetical protein